MKYYRTYTAPLDGYYEVASKMIESVSTGRTIEMKNNHRMWWKPWTLLQPKTYTLPEYEQIESYEGREVRFFKAGETFIGPGYRL